jgi:hypothetical protein
MDISGGVDAATVVIGDHEFGAAKGGRVTGRVVRGATETVYP